MTLNDIVLIRLHNQQLLGTKLKSPQALVDWMGAIQAQDYAMSKWAIGSRLPGSSDESIEKAIDKGTIIRTHILRPTWHLVSADDIYWMLELTAPHVRAGTAFMNRQLGLDEKVFSRSNAVIEKALRDNKHMTREELMTELKKAKINTDDLRGAHLMFDAELKGIVCNGAMRGKQFTYALLGERVIKPESLKKEEAVAKLALRYFTSHGPAALEDFIWWSGLSITNAKAGLNEIRSKLAHETIEGREYWFSPKVKIPEKTPDSLLFLPAFDEFMISYKDRSASIDKAFVSNAMTGNGIFKPIIVLNGKVIGTWKRTFKKDTIVIEPQFFRKTGNPKKQELAAAVEPYSNFMNMKTLLQ
jgi:hypothetical protein